MRRTVAGSRYNTLVRWAASAGTEPRIRAMVKLAASAPEMAIDKLQMDTKRQLLSVGNGTLDLETLTLRAPRPGDLITRGTEVPYLPGAECPAFRQYLADVFSPHGDQMVAYMQRVCGYLLHGENPEHVFFVLIGGGRNGKGVLVRVLHKVLGTVAVNGSFTTFCGKDPNASTPRPDLLRLAAARVVSVAEGHKERKLNSALVKTLSGDDEITVRDLYAGAESGVTYRPQFKLLFHTNALPETDATDDAFWERPQVIPFDVSFAENVFALHHLKADPTIEARIAEELPGILAWCVEGLRQWRERGLDPPEAVRQKTQEQRDEDDSFAMFVAETGELPAPGGKIAKADVRRLYERWCRENRVPVPLATDDRPSGAASRLRGH